MDRGGDRQAPVAVDRDARLEADRFPDLVNRGDILLEVAPRNRPQETSARGKIGWDGAGVLQISLLPASENLFAGHSLRSGLASSAEVDERYVQKQLGHASAEMTRKYQRRRDRFRINLTKASGL